MDEDVGWAQFVRGMGSTARTEQRRPTYGPPPTGTVHNPSLTPWPSAIGGRAGQTATCSIGTD